jgi:sugar transferase EpsL
MRSRPVYRRFGKRLFDLALTIPGLLMLAPMVGVIAALIRLTLGSPILFGMERPGLKGKPFIVYKFRTMRNAVDEHGQPLPDEARLTALGRFLRNTSLDELPELYHVLTGDMSLVGPRPLRMEFLDWYTPEQMHRHDIRPGITGWAQINGRNSIGWEKKLELDLWYVTHLSWWVDLKILLLTIPTVLFRNDVEYPEHATIMDFLKSRLQGAEKGRKS